MTNPDILDIQTAENDIVNSTTETILWSYNILANTLGINKILRIKICADYLNNSAGTANIRIKIIYGTTTMYNDLGPTAAQDASRRTVLIDFLFFARSANNSQGCGGVMFKSLPGGATTGVGDLADDEIAADAPFRTINASEDSTVDKVLKVTVTNSVADANISIRRIYAVMELVA